MKIKEKIERVTFGKSLRKESVQLCKVLQECLEKHQNFQKHFSFSQHFIIKAISLQEDKDPV
jgi:hypothetical protein